jgi:hypothetical protein
VTAVGGTSLGIGPAGERLWESAFGDVQQALAGGAPWSPGPRHMTSEW